MSDHILQARFIKIIVIIIFILMSIIVLIWNIPDNCKAPPTKKKVSWSVPIVTSCVSFVT